MAVTSASRGDSCSWRGIFAIKASVWTATSNDGSWKQGTALACAPESSTTAFCSEAHRVRVAESSQLRGQTDQDYHQIQRYGHVDFSCKRGQQIGEVGAVVERGMGDLRSPTTHWNIDGIVQPPTGSKTVALKKHRATFRLEVVTTNQRWWPQSAEGSSSANRHRQKQMPRHERWDWNQTNSSP